MTLSTRLLSTGFGAAILALAIHSPALALELTILDAKIQGGVIVVKGKTSKPSIQVTVDNFVTGKSDAKREFLFAFVYHPADCIVQLKDAANKTASAVVENCGEPGLNPRGAWKSTTNYKIDDVVTQQGSVWRAIKAGKNKSPSSHATEWEKFVSKGDTGAAGPKGATGAAGLKGDPGANGSKGDKGAKGDTGDTGATGPSGIVKTFVFSAAIANNQAADSFNWRFAGGTTSLAFATQQRVFVTGTGGFRAANGTTMRVDFGGCYRGGDNIVRLLSEISWQTSVITTNLTTLSAVGTSTLDAGTYDIGMCFRNESATGNNDVGIGWGFTTNPQSIF